MSGGLTEMLVKSAAMAASTRSGIGRSSPTVPDQRIQSMSANLLVIALLTCRRALIRRKDTGDSHLLVSDDASAGCHLTSAGATRSQTGAGTERNSVMQRPFRFSVQ